MEYSMINFMFGMNFKLEQVQYEYLLTFFENINYRL